MVKVLVAVLMLSMAPVVCQYERQDGVTVVVVRGGGPEPTGYRARLESFEDSVHEEYTAVTSAYGCGDCSVFEDSRLYGMDGSVTIHFRIRTPAPDPDRDVYIAFEKHDDIWYASPWNVQDAVMPPRE